jgi:penicillin-binding protein 2
VIAPETAFSEGSIMARRNEEKKPHLDRYIVLAIFIIFITVAIILQLVQHQLINGASFLAQSSYRILAEGEIYAARGNIYDRNGVPIAGSRMGYSVQYVDVKMTNAEKNRMLLDLIDLLEKNGETTRSRLPEYLRVEPVRFMTDDSKKFISRIVLDKDDAPYVITADQALRYMRQTTFEIDASYTEADAWKIMQFRYEILMNQPGVSNPMVLAQDVSPLTIAEIEERSSEFRGVSSYIRPYREYYNAEAISHILGYIGAISDEDLLDWSTQFPDATYSKNDIVGRSGIERAAEQMLRGVNGSISKEVDGNGKTTDYTLMKEPQPGKDVYLTIDLDLQKVAVESLARNIERIRRMGGKKNFGDANAGAVVAIDVKTGEVLAMASFPDYDPNTFLNGTNEQIQALLTDENRATWNRATMGAYPPGSTYKPLIAVAALESGIITPDKKVNSPYIEEIGNMKFTNLEGNQGYINLEKALATSSNMYFYKVGVQTGIDNIVKYAKAFGFGERTGIEIADDVGSLASREFKRKYYDEDWYPANTAMASIGQLYNAFTPLQIANYVATVANDGKRYTPHLIRMAVAQDGEITYEAKDTFVQVPVSIENIRAVKKGMVAVANSNDGTAVSIFRDFPFQVAGKTGTSETGRESTSSSHGLFICYAPYDDPQIAVAVVVEHGVWGAYTAPIARDVMMAYFRLNTASKADDDKAGKLDIYW